MNFIWITLGVLVLLITATAFICFRLTFFAVRDKQHEKPTPPQGKAYESYHSMMKVWIDETAALPCEEITITSFDGLTLYAKYYECTPDSPIELMMHGYRSYGERDLCGGVQRCFSLGHSAFIVDQRACGRSDGHVITFGIRESYDCQAWAEYLAARFGPDKKIMLTGISMGAASVLMAAQLPLPKTVVGILADCGYTSPREIIQKVIKDMKLPPRLLYPFVRLGAILFGGFDPDKTSPSAAMSNNTLPVLFIHGEADGFVPCEMSRQNFELCTSPKMILTVPDADHGLCYLVDGDAYKKTLREFCELCGFTEK